MIYRKPRVWPSVTIKYCGDSCTFPLNQFSEIGGFECWKNCRPKGDKLATNLANGNPGVIVTLLTNWGVIPQEGGKKLHDHVNYYVFFSGFCLFTPHPPRKFKPSRRIHWWSVDAQCQLVVLGQAFRSAWGACLDLSRTWKMRARAGAVGRRVPVSEEMIGIVDQWMLTDSLVRLEKPDGNMKQVVSDLFQMEVQSAEKTELRLHQNSHCSLVRRDPELLAFIITARCTTTYNTNIYVYTSWDACNAWI